MGTKLKIYIGFLILFFVGILIIDANKEQPINWTPTYSIKDKIPFGMHVLDQEMPSLLKKHEIEKINVSAYEYFSPQYDYDSLVNTYKIKGSFLYISGTRAPIDEESLEELFYFAGHGNNIFMSMREFPKMLLDSLKFEYQTDFEFDGKIANWMANPNLGTEKYIFNEGAGNTYFSKIDTLRTTVLGYQSRKEKQVNFIKVPYNQGHFYLHTQPVAFTNFYLLKENNAEYAQKILSYVPQGNVYWYLKNQNGEIASGNALRFIFNNPALSSAWYLFLIGMILFMIFNAKRRQRVVPIKKVLTNTTVDFAKTIGNLYFQEGDHGNLIDKKIVYFLERIRHDYLLDTTILDANFVKKLQHKSGKDLADIQRVVYLINQHRKNHFTSIENDLIDLNGAIEKIIN